MARRSVRGAAPAPTRVPYGTAGGRLSRTTILLHWAVGFGVLGLLAYGFWLQTLPTGSGRTPAVQLHKSIGMVVFVLALLRLAWRGREGFPPPAGPHRAWERRAARALHLVLIAATILMPLTGIARSLAYARPVAVFGIPVIPRLFERKHDALYAASAGIHDTLAVVLACIIGLHVAAALKHALLDRDGTLPRMLGRSAGGPAVPRR